MSSADGEELVESVKLYRKRPILFHGYIAPFIFIYAIWGFVWSSWFPGTEIALPENNPDNLVIDSIGNEPGNFNNQSEEGFNDTVAGEGKGASVDDSSVEAGLIGLGIIFVIQAIIYLLCHWSVHAKAFLTCSKEGDPLKADLAKVVPTPTNGSSELVKLQRTRAEDDSPPKICFLFQECKYEWNNDGKSFQAVEFPTKFKLGTYLNHKGYQDDDEATRVLKKYGPNKTTMRIPSFEELFTERATAPFFVFQVFCVLLWCLDEYWMYSVFTLMMLIIFECTLVQQQVRNMTEIRNMGNKAYKVQVYRNRKWRPISTYELLPADIVSVSPARASGSSSPTSSEASPEPQTEELIPCDLLLLRGSCIVDESMLTGESVPQMKEPIESEFHETVTGMSGDDRRLELESDGKLRILFGGTKLVQHTPPSKTTSGLRAPDNGCVCYVLRTGFSTSQGKLLRTIMYGVKRVTANNLESFAFICFLLIFAIAAAAYVWVQGTQDPDRNRYKLFLECTLILTSVVPPELPIELSLAVNSSVLSLTRLGVYCTEPFRIPFAGKTEICCFDKTGTLTSDHLIIEGVVSHGQSKPEQPASLSLATVQALASCHSLVTLDDGTVVGDPLEKGTLKWIDWHLMKDVVVPRKTSGQASQWAGRGVKVFHRFHFSSALKRMSVVAGFTEGLQTNYFAAVKGAPEVMKYMFANLPEDYEKTYLGFVRKGARVLALGSKELGRLTHQEIRLLSREDIESELVFLGFIIVSCPLKPDSKKVIQEIMHSSHQAVMITGDNPLTACHVAKKLKMAFREKILIFNPETTYWESIDEELKLPFDETPERELVEKYDLCLTGDGLSKIMTFKEKNMINRLSHLLPFIVVFARMAPKQKEWIINAIKNRGYFCLMCGDGTNDVGALKHAHVGVAILSSCPEWLERKQEILAQLGKKSAITGDARSNPNVNGATSSSPSQTGPVARSAPAPRPSNRLPRRPGTTAAPRENPNSNMERQLQQMLKELEDQERAQVVKLGDASIAAPFSSKMSSIECICHVIKQGRCTLVTTLQMFKILALNALVLAYSQSVLYLDGVKLSDAQATFHGLLLAGCFFFISHSKPLKTLSKQRPLPNIFNVYTLLTVFLQFFLHFFIMVYLVQVAFQLTPEKPEKVDLEKKFEPNLLNTVVYLISLSLQVTTFLVNYRGHPFMESITENKPFFYSLLVSSSAVIALVTRVFPDFNEQFEIVPIPTELQYKMLILLLLDVVGAFILDRLCMWLFGDGRLLIK